MVAGFVVVVTVALPAELVVEDVEHPTVVSNPIVISTESEFLVLMDLAVCIRCAHRGFPGNFFCLGCRATGLTNNSRAL